MKCWAKVKKFFHIHQFILISSIPSHKFDWDYDEDELRGCTEIISSCRTCGEKKFDYTEAHDSSNCQKCIKMGGRFSWACSPTVDENGYPVK